MTRSILLTLALFASTLAHAATPPKLTNVVLGYSASYRDDLTPVDSYDYNGLTHIARAFLHPNPDGTVDATPSYFDPKLTELAHAHGVKLLMSMGGEADDDKNWMSVATHPEILAKHLNTLASMMTEHHYDGVDIDWEPAPVTKPESAAYSTYLKALRAKLPQATLTVALPASEYWIGNVNFDDVIANVDFINVMVYDYAGGWGGIAGHGSNLYPPGNYAPTPGYSANEGMQNLLVNRHLPPNKLLMGLTFWGYRFRADKIGDTFPKSTPGYADSMTYSQIMDLLSTGRYLSFWDTAAKMPYLQRQGGRCVICYEDAESIRAKCDYAKANHCAGVMIWHAGADVAGQQAVLMDAVVQSNGGKANVLNESVLKAQIDELGGEHPKGVDRRGTPSDRLNRARLDWGLSEDAKWMAASPAKAK